MILFNAVLTSSDSVSASIFNEQKRKQCVESKTSTKKTRYFKKCCLNETDTAEVNKNTKIKIVQLRRLKICTINYCTLK